MADNLTELTRENVDRTFLSSIRRTKSPILIKLVQRKQFLPGGTVFQQINEIADYASLHQFHGANTPLVGGTKEIHDKPEWKVAFGQIPDEEFVNERIMNRGKGDHQLQSIAERDASNIVYSVGKILAQLVYSSMEDTEEGARNTRVQGVFSALVENGTYATIVRSGSTTNEWWQSADYANWDTAYQITKNNISTWMNFVAEFADDPQDLMVVLGTTLYDALQSEFEASNTYIQKGTLASQGFESMEYKGIEIAKDYWLEQMLPGTFTHGPNAGTPGADAGLSGTSGETGAKIALVLDMSTWHVQYWPATDPGDAQTMTDDWAGYIEVTEPFDQSKIIGGVEKWVRRFKYKLALTCDNPNRNLLRANVS